jgi:hypothetical protein
MRRLVSRKDPHSFSDPDGLAFIVENIDIPILLAMEKDLFAAGLIFQAELKGVISPQKKPKE